VPSPPVQVLVCGLNHKVCGGGGMCWMRRKGQTEACLLPLPLFREPPRNDHEVRWPGMAERGNAPRRDRICQSASRSKSRTHFGACHRPPEREGVPTKASSRTRVSTAATGPILIQRNRKSCKKTAPTQRNACGSLREKLVPSDHVTGLCVRP
jgi:hypothetical protein